MIGWLVFILNNDTSSNLSVQLSSTFYQVVIYKPYMSQTTFIVGTNGSGKSTIMFRVFNRHLELLKKEQMVNTINNIAYCVVEVDFEVGSIK